MTLKFFNEDNEYDDEESVKITVINRETSQAPGGEVGEENGQNNGILLVVCYFWRIPRRAFLMFLGR